jgi:pentatricopeptide repeat protein
MVKAKEKFDSMILAGIKPDVVVYNAMIDGYAKNGWLEWAIGTFNLMIQNGIDPDLYTYASMIDAYAKTGIGNDNDNDLRF